MDERPAKERDIEVGNLLDNDARQKLQREVALKRAEITDNVDRIRMSVLDEIRERKQAIRQATDWKYYVKKKPMVTMGGAAAIGFFLGAAAGKRIYELRHHEEPDWRDRAAGYVRSAERKFDELRGRTVEQESPWKARTRSAFNSGTNLLFREMAKAAQSMILPTVIAAITGKMASDNKTTIVEKTVHKTPPGQSDTEVTRGVTRVENGEITEMRGSAPSPAKADDPELYS